MNAAWLLIASAVGYWVITLAEHQKGSTKSLGKWLGAIIVVVSLVGAACTIYCVASGKTGSCPLMMGKWGACAAKPFACPMAPSAQQPQ